ncbi:MAG: hypothetical protein FWH01_07490 [Oscillospiraceae bacterium]|nr:hypothetical protein [Oscillospiraceae bacterium]
MSFINVNWYIALAFCLFFFIGGRQLAEAPGGNPRGRRTAGLVLFAFAAPALLFPLAHLPGSLSASPWYNTFRSINRIELFSALIAPAAGFSTYRKPDLPYREQRRAVSPVMRVLKPLAFPFCILFVSINFTRPLVQPLDKDIVFGDVWAENAVLMRSADQTGGPAALVSAMYSLNSYAGSEYDVTKGTYTDRSGTEFWYLARYASNRGYRARFIGLSDIEDAPVPSIVPLQGAGDYITLLGRSETGTLMIGDPVAGMLELNAGDYLSIYGEPELVLALSVPPNR